ncbi:hypothetical protein MP228_003844 [Amoeboaphelidium protococcarum]|nr:hypothetical protein MP228_003844 [Amoeboaphelidium protococcarum]
MSAHSKRHVEMEMNKLVSQRQAALKQQRQLYQEKKLLQDMYREEFGSVIDHPHRRMTRLSVLFTEDGDSAVDLSYNGDNTHQSDDERPRSESIARTLESKQQVYNHNISRVDVKINQVKQSLQFIDEQMQDLMRTYTAVEDSKLQQPYNNVHMVVNAQKMIELSRQLKNTKHHKAILDILQDCQLYADQQ